MRPSALAVLRLIVRSYLVNDYWQVGELLTLEDAVDIARSALGIASLN